MKTGPDLQETPDPAIEFYLPGRRVGNPGEDLQQGRFSSTIPADNTDDFTGVDIKRDIFEGIKRLLGASPGREPFARMEKGFSDRFAESFVFFFGATYLVGFAEVPDRDDWGIRGVGHDSGIELLFKGLYT